MKGLGKVCFEVRLYTNLDSLVLLSGFFFFLKALEMPALPFVLNYISRTGCNDSISHWCDSDNNI